jgi:hypothetical protein
MTLVGTFSLLLVAFAVPAFSAPPIMVHANNITQPAYNITRNDNVRIPVLDLRGCKLIVPTACCVCRHDFPQKSSVPNTDDDKVTGDRMVRTTNRISLLIARTAP